MSSLTQSMWNPTSFSSFLQPVDEALVVRSDRHVVSAPNPKEEARKRAYDEGFTAGHQEGLLKGLEEGRAAGQAEAFRIASEQESAKLDTYFEQLDQFGKELKVSSCDWFNQAEKDLTDLVSAICKQVLNTELALGRESILSIVHQAIEETGLKGSIRLRINPADRNLMDSNIDSIRARFAQLTDLKLVDDATLSSGCIIEASNGVVDATSDTKLAKIQENLGGMAA